MTKCCCPKITVNTEPTPVLQVGTPCTPVLKVIAAQRGLPGKDATINGVNALTLTTSGNVIYTQEGSVFNITTTTYVHTQGVASNEWHIQHNLNKRPSVVVVDTANTVLTPDVEYIDDNNVIVRTKSPFKGTAYLN